MLIQTIGGRYKLLAAWAVGVCTTFVAEDTYGPSVSSNNTSGNSWHYRQRDVYSTPKPKFCTSWGITIRFRLAYFEENQEFYLVQNSLKVVIWAGTNTRKHWVKMMLFPFARHLGNITVCPSAEGDSPILEIYSAYSRRTVSFSDFGAVKLLPKWLILQENKIYRCHWLPDMYLVNKPTATPKLSSDIYAVGNWYQALTGLLPEQLPKMPILMKLSGMTRRKLALVSRL